MTSIILWRKGNEAEIILEFGDEILLQFCGEINVYYFGIWMTVH